MILTILKIRCYQLFRLIKLIGLLRAVILLVLISFISLLVFNYIKQANNSIFISIVLGLIILAIHASRKDKRFLKINIEKSYFIFLFEYFILAIPIISVCLYLSDLKNILIIILICLTVPRIFLNLGLGNVSAFLKFLLVPFRSGLKIRMNFKSPIQNPRAFEWICGFRRGFFILIPVYLLVLAFSFKGYVAPIGMLILSIFISGFYFYGESRDFIILFSPSYKTFILEKIKLNLKYLFILFGPIIITAIIFQPETWYFITGAIVIASMIQIITIIIKYGLFIENSDLGHNGFLVFFNILCILLPFLWPLPIIMCIRYYNKAQINLKKYYNDFY